MHSGFAGDCLMNGVSGQGLSDERCKWPNTLSCGLAGKGRYDRNTGGGESIIIEGSG
jgi:hypothetical protein